MTEASLQAASAKYFALKLPQTFIAIHVSNEGRRGGRAGMLDGVRQKAAGLVKGCPDWLIVGTHPYSIGVPVIYAVELKMPGNYLSPAQKAFHKRLEDIGVLCAVCRSLDEIEAQLKQWGII